ncbi:hypothetical protein GCM10009810_19640 [Nostocoides vanveenii]|uniref:Uncharacterized protein n=1 Tax=Nostocoides vanveenii TaxID=330835 RepID=A0ABP4WQC7_9MICO
MLGYAAEQVGDEIALGIDDDQTVSGGHIRQREVRQQRRLADACGAEDMQMPQRIARADCEQSVCPVACRPFVGRRHAQQPTVAWMQRKRW